MASIGDASTKIFQSSIILPTRRLHVNSVIKGAWRGKKHAMSESDYKGTAAGTVLGGKHGTGGKKYGHAWCLKASFVTKIENR